MQKLIIILFLSLLLGKFTNAQLPPDDIAWDLVFQDDFNGSSLDTSKWAQKAPWNQYGTTDNNACDVSQTFSKAYRKWYLNTTTYPPDTTNTKVSGGSVKLYTRKENYTGEVWSWPSGVFTTSNQNFKYTSSMLYSKYKFKYGYFEIRFKLPAAPTSPYTYKGFGPNFWLFAGQNPPATPTWSEIDIFEIDAYKSSEGHDNYLTNTIHFASDTVPAHHLVDSYLHGNISANSWHTAAANWTPDKVEFYLDGVKIRELVTTLPVDSLIPMPIWIDVNAPTVGFCNNFDTVNTQFPYIYDIDYVKVYQKKMACDTDKVYTNVNSTQYVLKVYNSLTIGGPGNVANISNNASTSTLGVNYVLLNEGFEINGTTNCYINVLPCEIQTSNRFFRAYPPTTPLPPPDSYLQKLLYHH